MRAPRSPSRRPSAPSTPARPPAWSTPRTAGCASATRHGAPQDRYRAIYEETGLPLILFQYPDNTKANYNLDTQLEIAAQPGVFATKNGVRNMRRWDTEIPVLRREQPGPADPVLPRRVPAAHHVRRRRPARRLRRPRPEPLLELIAAGKARDYAAARKVHDRLLPVTKAVYHRGSHMEGTVALKIGLRTRGILPNAVIRSPLVDLTPEAEAEIADAIKAAGLA